MTRRVGVVQPADDVFTHRASRPHEPLRTFHPRRAPLGRDRADALERLFPRWGFSVDDPRAAPPRTADGLLDVPALFGRTAPLVLEIGSGMGDATAAMAAADPGRDYLAVEVHTPGIANLLALVEQHGLGNVRVASGDALALVRRLPTETLAAVHVFFPDPWPKARHHKRRLIQPAHVALLRSRLAPGGVLHCATDWAEYADAMRQTLDADPELVDARPGDTSRPAHRPVTKFERRALLAARPVTDLLYLRRPPG